MTPMDVAWLSLHPETPSRGYWDQAILEELFAGRLWRAPGWPGFAHHDGVGSVPDGRGAVVVLPGRHHADDAGMVTAEIAHLPWVLLVVTGDEESVFPVDQVTHPRMVVWVQTPHPARAYPPGTRFLVNGWTPAADDVLPHVPDENRSRSWSFAGQVTHPRRHQCAAALHQLMGRWPGLLVETPGFAAGIPQGEYLRVLADTRVAPCPSGPFTPDTFRFAESLQAGCVPVVDATASNTPADGYWRRVLGPDHPVPVVRDWADLPWVLDSVLSGWPGRAARTGAWWLSYQRRMAYALLTDLVSLGGHTPGLVSPDDLVTVLVPTSSIPSHPDTRVIEDTIGSVRAQLPHTQIVIMCDGLRADHMARSGEYQEYLRRLTRLCQTRWSNVVPVIHDEHAHQSGMTRHALDNLVTTPMILFVEHDTPITGDIDWEALTATVTCGDAGVIRLHHEDRVLPDHEHLMLAGATRMPSGAWLAPTVQWSQRPHLADAGLYRQVLAEHFAPDRRTMIEDVMHGVVQDAHRLRDIRGWRRYRLYLYCPEGRTDQGMLRSVHLDGRGADEKCIEA